MSNSALKHTTIIGSCPNGLAAAIELARANADKKSLHLLVVNPARRRSRNVRLFRGKASLERLSVRIFSDECFPR